jgi:hypothetical protein
MKICTEAPLSTPSKLLRRMKKENVFSYGTILGVKTVNVDRKLRSIEQKVQARKKSRLDQAQVTSSDTTAGLGTTT